MKAFILSNGDIITNEDHNENLSDVVGYICESHNKKKIDEKGIINVHKEVVIENKNKISLKIPILSGKEKIFIEGTIEKDKFTLNYYSEDFINFLKEKMSLNNKANKYMICLFLFQYLAYSYNEELLRIEQKVDNLFQRAVNYGETNNKEILKVKKSVSLIKRFITSYKFIITYLDDEFSNLDLFDKVLLVLDTTLGLVENIESSVFSCLDIFNSELSNKMNKTMQLFTIITVLPLPLNIISGIFGMNFLTMPLIKSENGFTISMGITLILILIQIIYFRKKKYL